MEPDSGRAGRGALDDLGGDVTELAVLALRGGDQQGEGVVRGAALGDHQDPLGLLDDRPELHRLLQPHAERVGVPVGLGVGQHRRRLEGELPGDRLVGGGEAPLLAAVEVEGADRLPGRHHGGATAC